MSLQLPQYHFSRLWRAVIEFGLIRPGDRILIGLSGGKDSLFLTYALAAARERAPFPFTLGALTIDPGFSPSFDPTVLTGFCRELGIDHQVVPVDIAGAIARQEGKDACFTCAFFRRGAMNGFAAANGYGKVALAHHHDDAVETFLMGLLYTGQLQTFQPLTDLPRTGLTVIRPLVYFRERDLLRTPSIHGFPPLSSPCPRDGHTKRQEIKELIRSLERTNPHVFTHLAAAMRHGKAPDLWPPVPKREEMKIRFEAFWEKI